jgi:hypothetical protein
MINIKSILYIIPLTFIIPLFFISCSCKDTPLEGEVTFLVGTMKINSTYASVGSRVIKGDTLVTDDKTEAVIQLKDSAVITLKSNTEMIFEKLSDGSCGSDTASLVLNKGTSLHKIMKSGSEYSVKAPTAVASVRGTEFEITADETRTIIKVTSGTVYVKKVSENTRTDKSITESQHKGVEEIILREGDSLQIYTLGAGARGHSDRSITGIPGTDKSQKKSGTGSGTVKKDKTVSAKSAEKDSVVNKKVSGKKQDTGKKQITKAGTKDSVKPAASAKKSKTAAAGTKDSKKSSGSVQADKASGSAGKESGKTSGSTEKKNIASADEKTDASKKDAAASADKKTDYTADTANKKASSTDRVSQKKTDGSTTDSGSGSDKISKSTDIARGKEKAPDPEAVRKLVNKKDRSINDIRKVYNRIDRVHLYSGKVITGAITERGEIYSILTTEGLVKIPKKDIQSNDIIK